MRAFTTYIEYLLMTRHYCYVPGRGAYMLAEEHAALDNQADSAEMASPCRTVCFNTFHQHDDGMLANLLMEAEGMTYDEACRYIERQAPLLSDDFLQEATRHTDIENFGFGDIHVDTWAAIERKKALAAAAQEGPKLTSETALEPAAKVQHDSISIPKYWIRRAAVVLLIIVCFFANFLGLNDRVAEEQLATVLDINMLQRTALVHQTWDESEEFEEFEEFESSEELEGIEISEESVALDESDVTDSYETTIQTSQTVQTLDPTKWNESLPMRSMDSELAMSQSPTGRLYYIIIASCATEADANRALGNLKKAGYDNVGVLERDGRFRLYVNFFVQKSEAEAYLTRVRGIERFHDAWLLPVREGSLSHIIKNTYNDNHVSMELSHLNQRTERDQG